MLGNIKNMVKGRSKPLQELVNVIHSKQNLTQHVLTKSSICRIIGNCANGHPRAVVLNGKMKLSLHHPNCHFFNTKNEYCVLRDIIVASNGDVTDFFTTPCLSSKIGVFVLSSLALPSKYDCIFNISDIKQKYVSMKFEKQNVLVPMLLPR